MKLSKKVFS